MPLIPFAPRMTDDGAREPASVTRVVAVDRAGCARVAGRLHVAHNPSVLGLGFEEISPGEISSHAGIARCYSGERMKISCIGSPRVRGTISVFVFLLSFFVVIVHAPKGLSTLAAHHNSGPVGIIVIWGRLRWRLHEISKPGPRGAVYPAAYLVRIWTWGRYARICTHLQASTNASNI